MRTTKKEQTKNILDHLQQKIYKNLKYTKISVNQLFILRNKIMTKSNNMIKKIVEFVNALLRIIITMIKTKYIVVS